MDKGWVREIRFLILEFENSITEAVLKGWWSHLKSNHCQGEFYFPAPLRVIIASVPMDHIY